MAKWHSQHRGFVAVRRWELSSSDAYLPLLSTGHVSSDRVEGRMHTWQGELEESSPLP